MATPRAAEHRDLEQRFRNLEAAVAELTNTVLRRQPIQVARAQVDTVITAPPADGVWTQLEGTDVPIPDGYTRAVVSLYAACGATFTGPGVVGVQPICDATTGPAISTGTGSGAVSVVSSGSFLREGVSGHINLDLFVNRSGTLVANSMNFHLSASLIFLR